jgi:uncharacterized protein (TIGR00297 family)
VLGRTVTGLALAGGIVLAARGTRSLTGGGAIAALAVGTICIAAGWAWGILLIAFFVASTGLSRWRASAKARCTEGILEKGGERDAVQVLANGGIFAACATMSLIASWEGWLVIGAGAIAAATADTWGTEIGALSASPPRSILTGRPVPPGTSGGVTVLGTAASVAGAAFIAVAAWLVGWPEAAVAGAVAGGIAGSTADSLLGASLQARRWCPACRAGTERAVHPCGTPTRPAGGLSWLGNDAVNALAGVAGALVAGIFA